MKKELTCINCPLGCTLSVETGGEEILVSGNGCPRGAAYARDEITHPTRMVTGLVRVEGTQTPLSVKTARPIPKEKIFACLAALRGVVCSAPVQAGDVVLANVCDTGTDVVATADALHKRPVGLL